MIQTISTKYIEKTRKPFLCDVCEQHIPAGGGKREHFFIDRGKVHRWQECAPCQLIVDEYYLEPEHKDEDVSGFDFREYAIERWGSMESAKVAVMSEVPE